MKTTKHANAAAAVTLALGAVSFDASADVQDSSRDEGPTPFALSLWNPVQTSDETQSVRGLRLNLPYGKNHDVKGLDLGVANYATGELRGVQYGLGGYVKGDVTGVQYNYILNVGQGNVLGWQAGIYDYAGSLEGVQTGIVNQVGGDAFGVMLGGVNVAEQSSEGVTLGVVNYAKRTSGLQLGLVNVTNHLYGVQIGLANYASNGFVPFFPVFNAAL
jgi:hypothetical protein